MLKDNARRNKFIIIIADYTKSTHTSLCFIIIIADYTKNTHTSFIKPDNKIDTS